VFKWSFFKSVTSTNAIVIITDFSKARGWEVGETQLIVYQGIVNVRYKTKKNNSGDNVYFSYTISGKHTDALPDNIRDWCHMST